MRFDRMPSELIGRDNWMLWRAEQARKVPYQADRPKRRAKTTDPSTWASFDATRTAYTPQRDAGVGFALDGDGLAVIDIDGDTSRRAVDLLHDTGCRYIEASPSGNGLHGWGQYDGDLPRKQGLFDGISIEIYNSARYMSVTGDAIIAEPFQHLDSLKKLSKSLACANATQEYTEYTEYTDNTGLLRNTQVSVAASSFDDACLSEFLPPTVGTRNKYLFKLTRRLKAAMPAASRQELREIIKQWHTLALPYIGTTEFVETWSDFLRGWDKVKYAEGEVLAHLLDGVDDDPLPAGVPDDYGERGLRLVKICRRLQDHHGDEPFFLSSRTAGELVGIHYTRAASMLRGLIADDVLELVESGSRKDGASEYRMRTEQC